MPSASAPPEISSRTSAREVAPRLENHAPNAQHARMLGQAGTRRLAAARARVDEQHRARRQGPTGRQPRPRASFDGPRVASQRSAAGGDHLDLVLDAADAGQLRDRVERGIALGLALDPALQGHPAGPDADVDLVRAQVGRRATSAPAGRRLELVVVPVVAWVHGRLVDDCPHTAHRTRRSRGRVALVEAADAASQRHRAVQIGNRDLGGVGDPGVPAYRARISSLMTFSSRMGSVLVCRFNTSSRLNHDGGPDDCRHANRTIRRQSPGFVLLIQSVG